MRGMGRQPPASGGERAFGASKVVGPPKRSPLGVFLPPEDFANPGHPLDPRSLGAELEGLE